MVLGVDPHLYLHGSNHDLKGLDLPIRVEAYKQPQYKLEELSHEYDQLL